MPINYIIAIYFNLPTTLGAIAGATGAGVGGAISSFSSILGNFSVFFLNQVTNVFSLGFNSLDCSRCVCASVNRFKRCKVILYKIINKMHNHDA